MDNTTKDVKDTVNVFVRIKPCCKNNQKQNRVCFALGLREPNIILVNENVFNCDLLLGPEVSQQKLFDVCMLPLLTKFLNGYNCTALAYGQTGTGKSYTMGLSSMNFEEQHAGIIQKCIEQILKCTSNESASENSMTIKPIMCQNITASFIEIYSEKVYDLLSETHSNPIVGRGYKYTGGNRKLIATMEDCYNILTEGIRRRHVRPTKMNAQSSRSHAIFTIYLHSVINGKAKHSCLNIVDLAGSEGVRRTGHEGVAMSEGVHINQGLLSISKVIQAMSAGLSVIPHRESILSSVLQDSLNLNSYITCLACISPCPEDLSESQSTLRFVKSIKQLKISPQMNEILTEIRRNNTKTPYKNNTPAPFKRPFSQVSSKTVDKYHTFCTPSKQRRLNANEFNKSVMGLTPKEKEKAQIAANHRVILNPNLRCGNLFEDNNKVRESCFDQTFESVTSRISFNTSSSTVIHPPTNNPSNYSPVLRKYIDVLDNKMYKCLELMVENFSKAKGNELSIPSATSSPVLRNPVIPSIINENSIANVSNKNDTNLFTQNTVAQSKDESKTKLQITVDQGSVICRGLRRSVRLSERPHLTYNHNNSSIKVAYCGQRLPVQLEKPKIENKNSKRNTRKFSATTLKTKNLDNSVLRNYFNDNPVTSSAMSKQKNIQKHRKAILELLNTGPMKQLQILPQIGMKTAYQIVTQRLLNGKFKSLTQVEQLPIWRGNQWERFAKANCLI